MILDPPIIVVGGRRYDERSAENKVEIFEDKVSCFVEQFPTRIQAAAGDNGYICGGTVGNTPPDINNKRIMNEYNTELAKQCWHLEPSGNWIAIQKMFYRRKEFTLTAVKEELFAIGGVLYDGQYEAEHLAYERYMWRRTEVEKYSIKGTNGSWSKMGLAPFAINGHCTVKLNNTHLMVIGGIRRLSKVKVHGSQYFIL